MGERHEGSNKKIMTTRLTNLATPFTFQFNVDVNSTPERLSVKLIAATIAFVEGNADADTITDSGGGFLEAGFQPGDQLTVAGSASNDGTYVVATVVAGTITLLRNEDLTDEAASATVTLTAPKAVPDGVSVTIKAKNANTGNIMIGYSSASALNTGIGWFSLDNNESVSLQVESLGNIWLDCTVAGEGVEVIFEKSVQA